MGKCVIHDSIDPILLILRNLGLKNYRNTQAICVQPVRTQVNNSTSIMEFIVDENYTACGTDYSGFTCFFSYKHIIYKLILRKN